jgi:type VI secretion system secreted protein VgrG
LESDYYVGADRLGRKMRSLFGSYLSRQTSGFWVTGHSLGGGMASVAAVAGKIPAYTFNAAAIAPATAKRFPGWPEFSGTNYPGTEDYITSCYIPGEILTKVQRGDVAELLSPRLVKELISLELRRPGWNKEIWNAALAGRWPHTLHSIDSVLIAEGVKTP